MERIFVAIAAYRDPEVHATLDDLFARAAHPERVRVGVCWQGAAPFPSRDGVRVAVYAPEESRGVGWARLRAEGLHQGEPWALQIDAHTRLADGWDETLLALMARCPSPRAVLTGTPPGYTPPDERRAGRPGHRASARLSGEGRPLWETRFIEGAEAPVRVPIAEPRFVFGPAAWLGADPEVYGPDEPAMLSLRLFEAGFAVFAAPEVVVWHRYNAGGDARPVHWRDQPRWRRLQAASLARWRDALEASPAFRLFAGLDDGMRASRAHGEAAPLAAGDCVPFFALPDHTGAPRQIHPYAGKWTLLLVLPRHDDLLAVRLHKAEEARRPEVRAHGLQRIYLRRGTVDEGASFRARLGVSWTVWNDPDGVLFRAFGLAEDQATGVLLTPNLRVLSIHTRQDAVALWNGVLLDLLQAAPEPEPAPLPMHAPVLLVPDALDPRTCARLAAYWTEGDAYEGFVGTAGGDERIAPEKKIRRDVDVRDADVRALLDGRLARTAFRELRKSSGFEVEWRETYKLVGYEADSGGHYTAHRDTYHPLGHRRYSVSVAITDDYEGGGLYFPEYSGGVYLPPVGTALVFPSTLMHGVHPVRRGLRLMLVSFLYDAAGDRVKLRSDPGNRMTAEIDLPGVAESDIVWKVDPQE